MCVYVCMYYTEYCCYFASHFSCDDEIFNAEDMSSMTPLMLATMNKHMEVAYYIIVMYTCVAC